MELALTERDKRLYTKLYASLSDIAFARACALHIQKKGWYRKPWSRGTIYFQQSVYVTSLIVSYARPFAPGRNSLVFPARLMPYGAEEITLHEDLLDRRHKVHAHSDLDEWNVKPWRSGQFETAIVGQPWLIIEQPQIDLFLGMTKQLQASIARRQSEILAAY